jgi:hypothetical protein
VRSVPSTASIPHYRIMPFMPLIAILHIGFIGWSGVICTANRTPFLQLVGTCPGFHIIAWACRYHNSAVLVWIYMSIHDSICSVVGLTPVMTVEYKRLRENGRAPACPLWVSVCTKNDSCVQSLVCLHVLSKSRGLCTQHVNYYYHILLHARACR